MFLDFDKKHTTKLLPRDSRIQSHFGEPHTRRTSLQTETPIEPIVSHEALAQVPDIGNATARIAAEANSRLKDITDLVQLRRPLEEYAELLRRHGKVSSSETLLRLIQQWADFSRTASDERGNALNQAQALYHQLYSSLEREVNQEHWIFAQQLLA